MKKVLRRIATLLVELVVEASLLSCYFAILLFGHGAPPEAFLGLILALPVLLALYGYYVSRALASLAWLSRSTWLYLTLASIAFLAHATFMAFEMWPSISPLAKAEAIPFIVGGACIVFGCALGGNRLRGKVA